MALLKNLELLTKSMETNEQINIMKYKNNVPIDSYTCDEFDIGYKFDNSLKCYLDNKSYKKFANYIYNK